jgi:hypothetical protein
MSQGRDRTAAAIAALATVLGLWLGLTAPSTSPVQPAPPTGVAASAQAPAP